MRIERCEGTGCPFKLGCARYHVKGGVPIRTPYRGMPCDHLVSCTNTLSEKKQDFSAS